MKEVNTQPISNPYEQLMYLQEFVDDTTEILQNQLLCHRMAGGILGFDRISDVDDAITESINENVEFVSEGLHALILGGMSLVVRGRDGKELPMAGLAFDTDTGFYAAVISEDEQVMLDGSCKIEFGTDSSVPELQSNAQVIDRTHIPTTQSVLFSR